MMSLVSVLGCGTWFFLIEERLYWLKRCATRHRWRARFEQKGALPSSASLYVLKNDTNIA